MSQISVTSETLEPTATQTPPPKKPVSKWRWLKRAVWALMSVLIVLMLALLWLTKTESGLRFTLFRIPAWFGVEITADQVSGSVWSGFKGENWVVKTEGADINLRNLNIDWASSELFSRTIHVRKIDIGEMHIDVMAAEPRPDQESTFPQSLRLPANVHLDEVNIAKITMGKNHDVILNQAKLNYHYQHGQPHRLVIDKLDSTFGIADGHFSLGESKPFATDAKLNVLGSRDGITVKGGVGISGDLDNTVIKGKFSGQGVNLDIDGKLHPFAKTLNEQFDHLNIAGEGLNPKTIIPTLPEAELKLNLAIEPIAGSKELSGRLNVSNGKPLPADGNGIPVKSIVSQFKLDHAGKIVVAPSSITTLQKGIVTAQGTVDVPEQQLNLNVGLASMTLADVIQNPMAGTLNGDIAVTGKFDTPQADWQLKTERLQSTGRFNMVKDRDNGQQSLKISKARIATPDGGAIGVAGTMNLYKEQEIKLALVSHRFNPAALSKDYPQGNVNLDARVMGTLAGEPVIRSILDLGNSTLSGAKLVGNGDVIFQRQHLSRANLNVLLDGNRIKTDGSIGKAADKLNVDVHAPRLDQFGFGLSGLLTAKGHVAGDPKKLDIQLAGNAQGLKFQDDVHVQQLRFDVSASPDMAAPMKVDIHGNTMKFGGTAVDVVNLAVKGTGRNHNIQADAGLKMDNKPYKLVLAAGGGLDDKMQWKGAVSTLDISGAFNAKLRNRMQLEAGSERVAMSSASWGLMGGSLSLQNFVWEAKTGLRTKGSATGLDIRQIDNLVQMPIEQNVIIGGDWDLNYGQNMAGFLRLNRQSGDIKLPQRNQMLGLSRLQTDTRFAPGSINTKVDIVTQYARANGQINIGQNYGNAITNASLSGGLKIIIDDIAKVRNFLPVGMEVTGRAQADVRLGGSVGAPQLSGPFTGSNLSFLDRSSGLYLKNGSLQSHFSGQSWVIEGLTFREGAGSARVHGRVNLIGSDPDVDVKVTLDRFEALSKPTQQLTLSGEANLLYLPVKGLTLNGLVKVDKARFDFPKSSAPSLSDDVVVLGRPEKEQATSTPINLDLTLDLNNAFRFNGQGLDVLMGGQLRLLAKPGEDVQGQGQIKVIRGRYKAYGQDLIIRRGYITFIDELANPTLNIRAERRASPVGAGVEVTGSLEKPNTVLVADEAMSDKDKLSWLILGRPSSGDSDDAAIAAAAGAWLAGNINDKVGIVDNIGLETRRTRNTETGEMNAAEQVINVSKRLTNKLSVGYEYGLTSAESTVKLIYYISRSFQVIGRIGSYSSGGEVRYTRRFD